MKKLSLIIMAIVAISVTWVSCGKEELSLKEGDKNSQKERSLDLTDLDLSDYFDNLTFDEFTLDKEDYASLPEKLADYLDQNKKNRHLALRKEGKVWKLSLTKNKADASKLAPCPSESTTCYSKSCVAETLEDILEPTDDVEIDFDFGIGVTITWTYQNC